MSAINKSKIDKYMLVQFGRTESHPISGTGRKRQHYLIDCQRPPKNMLWLHEKMTPKQTKLTDK